MSLAKFIAAARAGKIDQLRQWVNGKIVLIGSDNMSSDITDRFDTPFFTPLKKPGTTAGVEIHANVVRTLLGNLYLDYVPEWGRIVGLLLATMITAVMVMALPALRAVGADAAFGLRHTRFGVRYVSAGDCCCRPPNL